MARKSAEASQGIQRAYLYKGKDDHKKQKALEALIADVIDPSFQDFDLEIMEGDAVSSERIAASATLPPFASRKRLILVRHANSIPASEQEAIADFLPRVPDTGCVVFVVPAPEMVDGKPKKGAEVSASLSKSIGKVGQVQDFGPLRAPEAEEFVVSEVMRQGKKMERTVANTLVRRAGTDAPLLATEVLKLVSYVGDKDRITIDDVNKVTTETPEEKVFALVDAISAKNEAQALGHLHEVFSAGNRPESESPRLLALISRQFRLLWQFKYLSEQGYSTLNAPDNVLQNLPSEPNLADTARRQGWLVEKLGRQARNFERSDLEHGFLQIAAADAALKGIEGEIEDATTIMEMLVLGLCRRHKKA